MQSRKTRNKTGSFERLFDTLHRVSKFLRTITVPTILPLPLGLGPFGNYKRETEILPSPLLLSTILEIRFFFLAKLWGSPRRRARLLSL